MRIKKILGAPRSAVKPKLLLQGKLVWFLAFIFAGCAPQKPVSRATSHAVPTPAYYKDQRSGREAFAVPRDAAPLFDPKLAKRLLDDPKRDTWQKPQQIIDALKLKSGAKVADIGSGSGYLLPHLSRAVGPRGLVFAEEIQSGYFPLLKNRAEILKNVRVVQGTFDDPKLPQKIDCFALLTTYHEVQNPIAFLQTLKRYAKPQAKLAIIDFDATRRGKPPAPRGHEVADIVVIAEAKAAGWELKKRHEFLSSQFFLVFSNAKN